MGDLAVIVPVLARPDRAQPLAESLAAAATVDYELLWMCSPVDHEQQKACTLAGGEMLIVSWQPGSGDWARKINRALDSTDAPFLLFAADDVVFHPGFDEPMLALAREGFGVVGCRDLGNTSVDRGQHCCHPLVSRAYIDACGTIDECGKALHEGYRHNFVDVELVETAKARGAWAFTPDAVIEHLHPFWRKGSDDATYELGRRHYHEDARLYQQRRVLWERVAA